MPNDTADTDKADTPPAAEPQPGAILDDAMAGADAADGTVVAAEALGDGAEAGAEPAAAPQPNVFASAVWLLMAAPQYRHLFLQELSWRLVPPLMLRQFRLFQKDNKPVALATWAMLSEEVAERVTEDDKMRPDFRLTAAEWRSGERRVVVDVVAPFGGGASEITESVIGSIEKPSM
jgi:cytolysin-activating lysine-acyltransferase